MLRTQRLVFLLAVVFLVAFAPSVLVAQDDEGMPPPGEVANAVDADVNPPPDFLDGFEELNPVSEETLQDLAEREGVQNNLSSISSSLSTSPTFAITSVLQKYAPLPFCPIYPCRGIDHMAAGTALRNTGFGTIRLRGVPPGATPVSAFLYFGIIDSTVPVPNPLLVNFNGFFVFAWLVNTAPSPCWGAGTFRAYRALVLPLLAAASTACARTTS